MSKFGVPVREGNTITIKIDGKEIQLRRAVAAARWTFIFNTEGKLISIDKEVNAAEDSQHVLDFLENK